MIKKYLLIILAALIPTFASAQVAVGGWKVHSPFSGVQDIVETKNYVYYLSSGSVYQYDKATGEISSLSSSKLNDVSADGIYLDNTGKSVVVTYASANMDRVYDNGKIVNMSDIKDSSLSGSLTINDIAFNDEKFYVATDFGIVTYDNKKNEVRETAQTSLPVTIVAVNDDYVLAVIDQQIYLARENVKITSASKLKPSDYQKLNWQDIKGLGKKFYMILGYSIYESIYDGDTNHLQVSRQVSEINPTELIQNIFPKFYSISDGVYFVNPEGIYLFDKNNERTFLNVPRPDAKTVQMVYNGDVGELWEGDNSGIRCWDYTTPTAPALVHDNITGADLTFPVIGGMVFDDNGRLYLYTQQEHLVFGLSDNDQACVNILENGKIRDVSATDTESTLSWSPAYNKPKPHGIYMAKHVYPDSDPDAYWQGTLYDGMYRIKNGKQTHHFTKDNSPIINWWLETAEVPLVDHFGNLWIFTHHNKTEDVARLMALPKSKLNSENIQISDWKTFPIPGFISYNRDAIGLRCKHSNLLVFTNGRYTHQLIFVDTKGTETLNDDKAFLVDVLIDQDGKQLAGHHTTALAEDNRGNIWVGTHDGIFEIPNPTSINSSTANINHLKVPRNDGTGLADYLLSSQMVSGISVDASNRKWVSTVGSGAYYISENGDEILEHFTASNSILPNNIWCVAADPASNKVYFGTNNGLIEYSSTASPGAEDYSEVYAYPNPVRPDYTGWITITGLMENSLVKIADAAGNVFHQGRSNGGMYIWDGCNEAGERVKTGVYYVFASQNASGSNSACLTKIMVIN